MAAKDYIFCTAALTGRVYLTKKNKSKNTMSQDRRLVEDYEAIGCFEAYLRQYCEENHTDTLNVTNPKGEVIFTATLKKKNDDSEI